MRSLRCQLSEQLGMNPIESPLLKTTTITFFRSRGTSRRKIASVFHTVGIVAVQKQHTAITFIERDVSPANLFQRPIVDEPLAGACRGRLVSWFGTVLNHQGGSDKDRKMRRTHRAYTTSPSNQTPQPTSSRLVPPFPMIKILQRQPSTPLLGAAELELV